MLNRYWLRYADLFLRHNVPDLKAQAIYQVSQIIWDTQPTKNRLETKAASDIRLTTLYWWSMSIYYNFSPNVTQRCSTDCNCACPWSNFFNNVLISSLQSSVRWFVFVYNIVFVILIASKRSCTKPDTLPEGWRHWYSESRIFHLSVGLVKRKTIELVLQIWTPVQSMFPLPSITTVTKDQLSVFQINIGNMESPRFGSKSSNVDISGTRACTALKKHGAWKRRLLIFTELRHSSVCPAIYANSDSDRSIW